MVCSAQNTLCSLYTWFCINFWLIHIQKSFVKFSQPPILDLTQTVAYLSFTLVKEAGSLGSGPHYQFTQNHPNIHYKNEKKILEFDFAHKIPQLLPSAETFKDTSWLLFSGCSFPKTLQILTQEGIIFPSQYLLLSWPALRTHLSSQPPCLICRVCPRLQSTAVKWQKVSLSRGM